MSSEIFHNKSETLSNISRAAAENENKSNSIQSAIELLTNELDQKLSLIQDDLTINLNPGDSIMSPSPIYQDTKVFRESGVDVTILLKSRYEITEQIWIDNFDFGWVTISSEDKKVPIDHANLAGIR